MLAHLRDNDALPVRHLLNGLDNKGSGEHALVVAQRIHILQPLNVGDPLVMVNGIQTGVQLSEDQLCVPDDAGVHLDVLVDLRRIDVDLEDLGILRELGGIARHPVAEPGAHNNQKIRLSDAEVGGLGSVHSHHAGVELVGAVKGALAHQAVRHRCLYLVGKGPQLVRGIGDDGAAAHKDKGLAGFADHLNGLLHVLLPDGVALAYDLRRLLPLIFTGGRCHILGNINEHRSRPPGLGDGEGTAYHLGQTVYILYDKVILGNGHGHACDVHLLEAVLSQKAVAHIAGDGNHRHGIHIRCGNARYQVRRSRSGGGHADAHPARGPGISVRGVGRPLLVGGKDMGDLILVLVQGVINI